MTFSRSLSLVKGIGCVITQDLWLPGAAFSIVSFKITLSYFPGILIKKKKERGGKYALLDSESLTLEQYWRKYLFGRQSDN